MNVLNEIFWQFIVAVSAWYVIAHFPISELRFVYELY